MDSTYNIICFGFMPWSHMWKRNQSMMAEMSKWECIDRLIFVNPRISIRSKFMRGAKAINDSIGGERKKFITKLSSKLYIYSPISFLPFKKEFPVFSKIENYITLRLIKHLNNGKPYILFMNCPNIFSHYILDELLERAELSVFDFSDDFSELGYGESTQELFRSNATKYAKKANIVLTVNEHLKNKYSFLNSNIHVLRNATNYENFDRTIYKPIALLERFRSNNKPIIGYSGIANLSRIDADLLEFLLEMSPNWQFVFIGPIQRTFKEKYSKYDNVAIIGPVKYQDLPCYLQYFDVAIVPFLINEHTKGNDLLKLHDLLAMGKPIVSTEIGGAKDLKDVIRIVQKPSQFLDEIEKALVHKDAQEVGKRKNKALKNSWQNRIKELEPLIEEALSLKVTTYS